MDEADLLGDRIAIVNSGKLVCVGSSIFLRWTLALVIHLVTIEPIQESCFKLFQKVSAIEKRIFYFQRSTYGNGYYLTLVMNNGSDTSTSGTEEGEGKMSFTDSLKKKNPFNDLDDIQDGSESTQQILNVASSPGFPTNSVVFSPYPF